MSHDCHNKVAIYKSKISSKKKKHLETSIKFNISLYIEVMQKETYKIIELDCAKECFILKKALSSRIGIEDLDFDVINQEMTVFYDPAQIDPNKILNYIHSTGMTVSKLNDEKTQPFWQAHLQLISCIVSGIFLVIGFLIHWKLDKKGIHHSIIDINTRFEFPSLIPSLFYFFAIISSGFFVAQKALKSLRNFSIDINILMFSAAIGAICIGQLFEAASVVVLFSFALLLEHWSVERARKAINSLFDLTPKTARVIQEGQFVEMQVENVALGQHLMIQPGEKFPLDGTIISGSSFVNQAPITGESLPIAKEKGDSVFAGTINEDGALIVKTTKKVYDTTIAKIIEMVKDARSRKAKSEQWINQFCRFYTPIMIGFAFVLATIPPLFLGLPWIHWIYRGLILLIIACPCSLVISTPVSVVSALTTAARSGVLIKGGIFLEIAAQLNVIAFDKTGTLTIGEPKVQKIFPLNSLSENDLLEIAANLECQSEHPLARAILTEASERGIEIFGAKDFKIFKGLGAEGTIKNKHFWIGSHRFMLNRMRKCKEEFKAHVQAFEMEKEGHSVIMIGDFSHICGLISVADKLRDHMVKTLTTIQKLGIENLILLTGDNKTTAKTLVDELGFLEYKAELLPEEKLKAIEDLKMTYSNVAMVGDGINDAPALAASNLGIAMGGLGTDIACEAADIVLVNDDLTQIPWLIRHARNMLTIVKQNIVFSLFFKSLFVLLATLGYATLWMAVVADTGASLLVIFNGLRLLKRKA